MLEAILAAKRAEVEARKQATSLESLLGRCLPSQRSLAAALRRGQPGFLLEVKCVSPSAGILRSPDDLDPVLGSYARHADAVSVLTDRTFFHGSLDRLAAIRARLDQPLLCKDFFLEPYQVAEARAHGADAILLILAAVEDPVWHACAELARRLGMAVLTEVHSQEEADRAVALDAGIIGVNNRDLRTLEVDPMTVARIAPSIPDDRLIVAESGVENRRQVEELSRHADAFLVGSTIMRAVDPDAAVRDLVYGRTKICGLTRPEHAEQAWKSGATHGGLVFAAGSPRKVTLNQAEHIREAAPLDWVGVFADQEPGEIAILADHLDLAAVQLHGSETFETVRQVKSLVDPGCEVWKAIRVMDHLPARDGTGADRLLLDGGRGGSGTSFDWDLLDQYPERDEVVLAGGISDENAAIAAAFRPYALDVSSGVESIPGEKDAGRMAAFFAERRRLPGRMP